MNYLAVELPRALSLCMVTICSASLQCFAVGLPNAVPRCSLPCMQCLAVGLPYAFPRRRVTTYIVSLEGYHLQCLAPVGLPRAVPRCLGYHVQCLEEQINHYHGFGIG